MRSVLLGSLATLAFQNVYAHPTFSGQSQATRALNRRVVDLNAFRQTLKTEYKNAPSVQSDPSINSIAKRADAQETATELVKTTVPGATFRLVNDHYVGDNGIAHFNFKQTANGLDIENADFNVNIGRNGEVFSFGNSFFKGTVPPRTKRATIDPAEALKGVVSTLQLPIAADEAKAEQKEDNIFGIQSTSGTVSEPEARLVYVQTPEGELALTWRVETDIDTNWLLTFVDAHTGDKVHSVVDYSADATYEVYPWGINDPTEGERIVIKDPFNLQTSEFGWHSTGVASYTSTRGNNGIAQNNRANSNDYLNQPRPSNANLDFQYPFDLTMTNAQSYSNASVTQLFYTANKIHDLLYTLGFTEKAGNFESNNNGAGGAGNDFVILNAQDGSGVNNANFATPPDGQNGRMRMYMWNGITPNRDGSFEAGIVIHEYGHGLSNRLTGGPANSQCLSILEAGGMGEGWSDFYATAIRLKKDDTAAKNYPMGAWASNRPGGIRAYPYSTSLTTNPLTYTSVNSLNQVHAIGTVWATMLYEVMWGLINKYGKNDADLPDFNSNGVPTDGKYLAMKLVLDGMALQPCNPNFVSARDAIIDADEALTGGVNACILWTAFAKRGLGSGARYSTSGRTGSNVIPAGVC